MNELQVENKNGELLISARDLHKGLEITDRFSRWFNRMLAYGFEKDIDFAVWNFSQSKINTEELRN